MADDSHHGEGEHDEGDVAVPAMPGAGLVIGSPLSPLSTTGPFTM
jgi:hypothetical protein